MACDDTPETSAEAKTETPMAPTGSTGANDAPKPPPRTPALMRREDPGLDTSKPIGRAIAVLQPTEGNELSGVISLAGRDDSPGLTITADLENVPEGKHAFHVHLFGDCSSPDGKSAGTHFNFLGSSTEPPEDVQRITGNLGEIESDDDGTAHVELEIDDARLQGPYSIVGRSIVVHERPNDPEKPPIGGAGGRIACGVIGATAS